ncbi:sigma-E factor regulatory protein RseB domain-containing protein [Quadrisphaera sp. DSM 44207]|uniref:LolA family protein n=1 Tax=Quadrisphaera sp. DSM 44207 TaxID=1881057 RepID=UPI00088197F3|nr:sigma-E factor regulatory protein RseB domain-containing protein [Quadrisphaera sp. DSM 44207]SDQ36574.1 Outer membrane lipoprotein-sorting protein [Quadrisphaera sp. DSM 44207]
MRASRPATRWALPTTVAAAVVGTSLIVPAVASAEPELPPTTAAELLEDLAAAEPQDHSGTLEQTTDLGLPELPAGQGAAGGLSSLLAGTTTAQVWADGPDRSRLSVIDDLAETTVVRDGQDLWVWRSDTGTAAHGRLPEQAAEAEAAAPLPMGAATPAEAAQTALAAIEPTTAVELDGTARVAGRDAHELVLSPREEGSLVGRVRLAVDAETSLPLRVQVLARGASEPAFTSGYTDIDLTTPDADVFAFAPPQGAEVTELDLPEGAVPPAEGTGGAAVSPDAGLPGVEAPADPRATPPPAVVGEGWTSVLVMHGTDPAALLDPAAAAGAAQDGAAQDGEPGSGGGDLGGVGQALAAGFQPYAGDAGAGRVLSTSLLTVLALEDGRVLVGAVGLDALERAALDPAAAPLQ